MNNDLIGKEIINANGIICTHSMVISERFEKRHDNIIRDIENIIKKLILRSGGDLEKLKIEDVSPESYRRFFVRWDTEDSYGRPRKGYAITRDGFCLLVMGMNGAKAMKWKIKFLDAFNIMEENLKNQKPQITKEQELMLKIYSGGEEGVLASKELSKIKVWNI